MIITPTDEQREYAKAEVKMFNGGSSYALDMKLAHYYGILSEVCFSDLLKLPRTHYGKKDGGIDFKLWSALIDIKTRVSKRNALPSFTHAIPANQVLFNSAQVFILVNANTEKRTLDFYGIISKKELIARAKFRTKGTQEERLDGTTFIVKCDDYALRICDVEKRINNIDDIRNYLIKRLENEADKN